MSDVNSCVEPPLEALECLRDLTVRFYNHLLAQLESGKLNIKPGEFMKMIELTNKFTPTKSEQQEFWSHIDKIRREHLSNTNSKAASKKSKVQSKSSGSI